MPIFHPEPRPQVLLDVLLVGRTKILKLHGPLWATNSTKHKLGITLVLPAAANGELLGSCSRRGHASECEVAGGAETLPGLRFRASLSLSHNPEVFLGGGNSTACAESGWDVASCFFGAWDDGCVELEICNAAACEYCMYVIAALPHPRPLHPHLHPLQAPP